MPTAATVMARLISLPGSNLVTVILQLLLGVRARSSRAKDLA